MSSHGNFSIHLKGTIHKWKVIVLFLFLRLQKTDQIILQVTIGNVHVRYEDMVTNPDHPFACGLMLKHISGYTTNSKWQPSQLDSSATVIYKVCMELQISQPGRIAQSVGHLTRKSGVLGSILGLATYFRFSFRFFKKGSCQLLAKVCAQSTGQSLRRSKPAQEKCG